MDSIEIYGDVLKLEAEQSLESLTTRRSQLLQEAQVKFNALALESIEIAAAIDPFQSDLPEGVEIPAVDAVGWIKGHRNCDLRPDTSEDLVTPVLETLRHVSHVAWLSVTCPLSNEIFLHHQHMIVSQSFWDMVQSGLMSGGSKNCQ